MDKKICLITGASSGIGKAAAIQIAEKGYHVILACRNPIRGEAALNEVRNASKSDSVELMIVDMSLQSSIKNLARTYLAKYDTLDVLIHNAADFDISEKKPIFTEEGTESIWATNHLGPVLLTELLLEPLKHSPQGRIITIASKGLVTFPFLRINIEDPELKHHNFSVVKAYYQSKLAQIMYTYWLARKLEGTRITANCVRVTNVKINISRYPNLSRIAKLMYTFKSKFSISNEEMAKTYAYLATSDIVGGITGKFNEKDQYVISSKYSCDSDNINKVMELTKKYIYLI